MNDEESASEEKTRPSKKRRKRYARRRVEAQPDALLGLLVKLAEEQGVESGLTLTVGGSVVTGTLVGRREWLRRLFETHEALRILDGVQQAWDEAADEAAARLERDPGCLEPFESEIHLVDARYVMGVTDVPSDDQGMFWRGRLAEVDGWSFGTFSRSRGLTLDAQEPALSSGWGDTGSSTG